MKELRNEEVDEEELLLVRNYMMGTILGDLDGPFQIINSWKNIILNGFERRLFLPSDQHHKESYSTGNATTRQ